ncbi:hypothetical protein [Streptomyces sp. LN325]|uniref:hypothetical protein n=1 Tax=Streptomyces sp. LN325 TaxID=3112976 RepID=UPI003716802C
MSETPQLPYRLGEPDIECRYPVLVGTWFIGHALRWHGVWYAVPAGTTTDVRVADGGPRRGGGSPAAAAWLYSEFTEGRITPQSVVDSAAATLVQPETVPLLHPRMPETARNIASARTAFAGLEAHRWTPYGGYPGSDNPWVMECQLCGWKGPRYWSHLRGRNGQPPTVLRHDGGCIGADKVREAIGAYER